MTQKMELFVDLYCWFCVFRSFDGLCTRLQHSLDDLRELVVVNGIPSKDSLVQLFFTAIQALHSVSCSSS